MKCRLCHSYDSRVQLRLTPTPLANSFAEHPDRHAPRYPLNLQECLACGHIQLDQMVPISWDEYLYASPVQLQPHMEQAATVLRRTYPQAKTVLEIGCNNGRYLEELRLVGLDAIGVDPCTHVGIRAPFSAALAMDLEQVDLIVANNVLAHVDDLWDVFRGIDHLLKDDGAVIFEVQYFPDLVTQGAFDMIYHEHRDYHTLAPLVPFLKRFGLVIADVEYISTNGGSVRLTCARPGVACDLEPEPIDWKAFRHKIAEAKQRVLEQVAAVEGSIVAFGATAKACTLIHHFGLAERIDYCVDGTPAKQGRYIPGTNIQIYPERRVAEVPPAAVLMTAWNFKHVLMSHYPQLHWVIPFEEGVCR